MIQLRRYQQQPAAAILHSIDHQLGHTITVEMSRQAGKNELSAQIEMLLLTLFGARGGSGVKAAPTWRPQAITSLRRLRQRLRQANIPFGTEYGYLITLGAANWAFLSAAETSNVVGNTASILLEGDEAQDITTEKWDKDLSPMRASTGATAVLWGTAWDDTNLLERTRQENTEFEAKDGLKRNFTCDWQAVGAENPAYLRFAQAERDRLGESHPLFATQYALKPLAQQSRMFSLTQLALLHGDYPLQTDPHTDDSHVAAIDVAGAAEAATDGLTTRTTSARDSTVLTIGATRNGRLDVVAIYAWTDQPHHTTRLQVGRLFEHWHARSITVDATGAGEPYAQELSRTIGPARVNAFHFSQASKSELAYGLLARINRNELTIGTGPEAAEMHRQLRLARNYVKPNRCMDFNVPETEGHDDHLMSLALLSHAADHLPARRVASGR